MWLSLNLHISVYHYKLLNYTLITYKKYNVSKHNLFTELYFSIQSSNNVWKTGGNQSLRSFQWNQYIKTCPIQIYIYIFPSNLIKAKQNKISFHLFAMEIRDTTFQVIITFSVVNTNIHFHTLIQFPTYFLSISLVQHNSYICLMFYILYTYQAKELDKIHI